MKTKKTPVASTPASLPDARYSQSQIADRAYELWLREGQPDNRHYDHWFEAERQLRLGKNAPLHDDARRLTAEPNDPASSKAAEMDEEIDQMAEQPASPRSATSLT